MHGGFSAVCLGWYLSCSFRERVFFWFVLSSLVSEISVTCFICLFFPFHLRGNYRCISLWLQIINSNMEQDLSLFCPTLSGARLIIFSLCNVGWKCSLFFWLNAGREKLLGNILSGQTLMWPDLLLWVWVYSAVENTLLRACWCFVAEHLVSTCFAHGVVV